MRLRILTRASFDDGGLSGCGPFANQTAALHPASSGGGLAPGRAPGSEEARLGHTRRQVSQQAEVERRWREVTSDNVEQLADLHRAVPARRGEGRIRPEHHPHRARRLDRRRARPRAQGRRLAERRAALPGHALHQLPPSGEGRPRGAGGVHALPGAPARPGAGAPARISAERPGPRHAEPRWAGARSGASSGQSPAT